jgi:formylglycine-generating enzyme required for sulfatase activity
VRTPPRQARQVPRLRRAILLGAAPALGLALALVAYSLLGGAPARPPADAVPSRRARSELAPQRSPGSPSLAPGSCPEGMVSVPAGTFQMGSPDGAGNTDERPRHQVTLSAYCIDTTEVTVAAYAACVASGACRAAPLTVNWTSYPPEDVKTFSRFCNRNDRPDHPINCVDWDQAAAYCAWNGKRLPTEAEWEYAARGTDGRVYPWGNDVPTVKRLNVRGSAVVAMTRPGWNPEWSGTHDSDDGWGATAPVGSFPNGRSPVGALDMAGNVWEWTADWYGAYSKRAETDPRGAKAGTSRVVRGAGWATQEPDKFRAARRIWSTPLTRDCDIGFRCAQGN